MGRTLPQNGVYDPNTTRTAPDGSVVRDLYMGNKIPLTQMDPVAGRIQALIPLPLNSGAINNYPIPAYTNFRHTTIPSFKLDHNVTSSIKVAGYYSQNRTQSPNANGFTQAFASATPTDSVTHTIRINYDQIASAARCFYVGSRL